MVSPEVPSNQTPQTDESTPQAADLNTSLDKAPPNTIGNDLGQPAWNLANEYPGFESEKFQSDLASLKTAIARIKDSGKTLEPDLLKSGMDDAAFEKALPVALQMQKLSRDASLVFWDLSAYTHCFAAVDGNHVGARKMQAALQDLGGSLNESLVPLSYFVSTISTQQAQRFLSDPIAADSRFQIEAERSHAFQRMLSPSEERLLSAFVPIGTHTWNNLYEAIASSLRVEVEKDGQKETIGMSQVNSYLGSPDREVRKRTWRAVNEAWSSQKEAAAAGLNALAAWRLKDDAERSTTRPKHFLDNALYSGRIDSKTVEVMMGVVAQNRAVGQRALKLIACGLGADSYEPWDKFASVPPQLVTDSAGKIRFSDAIEELKRAFGRFHPELGEFVQLCADREWIEARSLPSKRPGAFSHLFMRSGEPRTYLNWNGSQDDLRTFAHETGHSHHSWVMRDIPVEQRSYPMTLAETASNMGEMLLMDYQTAKASSPADLLPTLWEDMQSGVAYLLNIPLRFAFETALYRRREREFITADELSEMMIAEHRNWYGDASTQGDPMFWASKQHFHFSDISFYNFPYTYGYLFASGIHSLAVEKGADFYRDYVALLRDTGRMSCEDLAAKHLGVDLRQPNFWQRGMDDFARKVDQFEAALRATGIEC